MENLIRWVGGLILLVTLFYVLFLVVNQQIQDKKYGKTYFKCTYIEGKCNKYSPKLTNINQQCVRCFLYSENMEEKDEWEEFIE